MKKLIPLILTGAMTLTAVRAAQVTVTWDPSTEPNAVFYKVYWGSASGTPTNNIAVTNSLLATIPGLFDNTTYYITATATRIIDMVESLPSNEITYRTNAPYPPPSPPMNLREYTDNGGPPPETNCTIVVFQNMRTNTGYGYTQCIFNTASDYASPFQVSSNVVVCEMGLVFGRVGTNMTGTVRPRIYDMSPLGFRPGAVLGHSTTTFDVRTAPSASSPPSTNYFSLGTELTLPAGTYWVVLHNENVADSNTSNYLKWYRNGVTTPVGGVFVTAGGDNWATNTTSRTSMSIMKGRGTNGMVVAPVPVFFPDEVDPGLPDDVDIPR